MIKSIIQAGICEVVFVEYVKEGNTSETPHRNCYSLYNRDGEFLAEIEGGWVEDV